ncbi:LOW QUALITY PROTEIN: probable ATP-dependent RNA helicase DDX10 [Erpetoichthys calabaricus]|uniref:LOW QUALITY PROTEIN: probable ATP-dependent RNA helicase DDX10 n=1 Tax=Erpetoichthys calabaricus TaxID=27687 RepID=UPI002234B8B7|nr:LOW QUALITY PROTEIN: probable ATP-dependent RNA helicase DDX10 [Erpetoichthys calabaricus]
MSAVTKPSKADTFRNKKKGFKAADKQDPVKNFEKWKKKYDHTKNKLKTARNQKKKKPEWQVERETISKLIQRYSEINPNEVLKFSDFPLSKKTVTGLLEGQYRTPTEIQKQTIGLALQGKDILGAAKTGSGKTLAFLVPILECLFRQQWTADDGLGALIISPTRELAYQTYEVLRKVGKNHEFSAGLIIGGKDLKHEADRIHRTNIIICTPGRLLQHMDETMTFHALNLQMLVLDEADRILDMGFADAMNAIIENLPKTRQTLLFSATQTKSVKDLARLSLKDPSYVWVHEKAKFSTPATLEQSYVVCDLSQKVNMLFSFVKNHTNKKIIVFFASCKEVQYLFRAFCRLRPGISVLALHGKQLQLKRMEVYNDFVRKKAAVLFATDIAARGLDFPAVNWVLQFDCPEDASTYIHRVGRTARYKEGGEALLILTPSEEQGMLKQLEERKVPVSNIKVNPDKLINVQQKLEAFLAQEQELKERAQRCFVSYLRSVYLMKNKEVFDVFKLPLPEYAQSLGLAVAPRVRFIQKAIQQNDLSSVNHKVTSEASTEDTESSTEEELENFKAVLRQQPLTVESKSEDEEVKEESHAKNEGECSWDLKATQTAGLNIIGEEDEEDDLKDLDLLTVKRKDVFGVETAVEKKPEDKATVKKKIEKATKFKAAKKILKRNFKVNTKLVFTEEGEMVQQWPPTQKSVVKDDDDDDDATPGINMEKARERLIEEDKFDKEEYRRKVKEKHREKRLKERAAKREAKQQQKKDEDEEGEEDIVYLNYDSENEFDPDTLPDPDELKNSDQEHEDNNEDTMRSVPFKKEACKRNYTSDSDEEPIPQGKKKKNFDDTLSKPLDTGLSLAEDEELALHLLSSRT